MLELSSTKSAIPTLAIPQAYRIRLVVFFALAIVSFFAGVLIDRFMVLREMVVFPQLDRIFQSAVIFCPALYLTGILVLLIKIWPRSFLAITDLVVNALGLACMAFLFAAIAPSEAVLPPFVLFLLTHAVIVPCRGALQGVLGGLAVACFAAGRILPFYYLSDMQRALIADGAGKKFWETLSFEIAFLIAIAVLATWISALRKRKGGVDASAPQLGNYVISKYLGTGGMGKVYVASHRALCRPSALKILENKKEDPATAMARFEREVKLCATLSHPNTITIFDYGQAGPTTWYYAMELLEGMDLQKLIKNYGAIPANRAAAILLQVCSSLAEAHRKGIIHRDIKPSNIFISQIGGLYDFVKVLDFGLAKEIEDGGNADLTQTDSFLGTPNYVAPEMIFDRAKVDGRSDIYMVGCVAYWTLTGHPPFEAENNAQILAEHMKSLPKWPSEKNADIPSEFERIVMKCLEKRMEDRYQSIEELAVAIAALQLAPTWTQTEAEKWWRRASAVSGEVPDLTKRPA